MEDYTSSLDNLRNKPAEKKIEKVISGKVVVNKKSSWSKFKESFIAEDMNAVKDYIITEVAIPQIQNFIMNSVNDALSILFTGSASSRKVGLSGGSKVSYIDYSGLSKKPVTNNTPVSKSVVSAEEIIIPVASKGEAERLRDTILEVIDQYGNVSVNDLYDMVDDDKEVPPTLCKYGWKLINVKDISIEHDREGYYIRMPKMVVI